MSYRTILFAALLFSTTTLSAKEISLRNNSLYDGCEDSYLSALYEDTTLLNMIGDTLTNHSTEDQLHLS